jgi:hypothetical protein
VAWDERFKTLGGLEGSGWEEIGRGKTCGQPTLASRRAVVEELRLAELRARGVGKPPSWCRSDDDATEGL